MQAIELFAAFIRSADAMERIANSLEILANGEPAQTSAPSFNHPDLEGGGQPTTTEKRKRRTKAEIEAEKAAQAQGVTLPADVTAALSATQPAVSAPPVVQPTFNAPPVPQPAAIPVAQPAATPLPQVDPRIAQLEATLNSQAAAYAALPVEQQFSHLLTTFAPHSNVGLVRDALVYQAQEFGVTLPMSNPDNPNLPGDSYRVLTNEQRFAIYRATSLAIGRAQAAV